MGGIKAHPLPSDEIEIEGRQKRERPPIRPPGVRMQYPVSADETEIEGRQKREHPPFRPPGVTMQ